MIEDSHIKVYSGVKENTDHNYTTVRKNTAHNTTTENRDIKYITIL